MRTSKPISVTLGSQQSYLDRQLASGEYASASEVVRAGLKALEREHNARTEWMRIKVEEALSDPRPGFLADDVFARLEQQIRTRGTVRS